MRKRFKILLFVGILLSIMIKAHAYEKFEIDGIIYEVLGGQGYASVAGLNQEMNHDEVVIPSYVTYEGVDYLVKKIKRDALRHQNGYIKSLTIGPNVITIECSNGEIYDDYETLRPSERYTTEGRYIKTPIKVIWLTNTPPDGYENLEGEINYVSNDLFTKFKNKLIYPLLSSMFEVDGVKYIPVSMSERTCDAFDCLYNNTSSNINIGKTVSYKGVSMTVKQICPFAFIGNIYMKKAALGFDGQIGEYAFCSCHNLEDIVIPDGITAIGGCAFRYCINMKSAKLGKGLKSIEKYTFIYCENLTDMQIGSNVESIKWGAFAYCKKLHLIMIPKSVVDIENFSFYMCTNLKTLIMEDQDSPSFTRQPQILDDWESSTTPDSHIYEFYVNTGDVLSFDFYGYSLYNGVSNCRISVVINGIEAQLEPTSSGVGTYSQSFSNSGMVKMEVKSQYRSGLFIPDGIFNVMVGEKPRNALRLGSNNYEPLFSSCPLDSVYIGRKLMYPAISSQGYSPFYRKASLRSVRITDMETTLPNNEFYGCTGLKNVWIGNGVYSIGNWVFSDCFSLDYFEFGYKMTTIGMEAFSDCTNVTKIISHAANPPVCDTQALDDINKWNCKLMVPKGYESSYQTANQWKEFLFIEGFQSSDPVHTVLVTNIQLNASSITMEEGDTKQLSITVQPADATDKSVSWSSSNNNIATVSSTGIITAVHAGTATITCTANDGSGKNASCNVKINNPEQYVIELSSAGYATFYDSKRSYSLPTGLTALVIVGWTNNKFIYKSIGGIIPKGVAVVLTNGSNNSGTYTLTKTDSSSSYHGSGYPLQGSDIDTKTTGYGYHYKLSYGISGSSLSDVFGWYWGAENGEPFQIEGHKAWLVLPEEFETRSLPVEGEVIWNVSEDTANDDNNFYDLQGRRINRPIVKGIYVMNGKKVIIK